VKDYCHLEVGVPFVQPLKQLGLLDFDRLMHYTGGGVFSSNSLRLVVRIASKDDSLPGFFLKRHFKTPVAETAPLGRLEGVAGHSTVPRTGYPYLHPGCLGGEKLFYTSPGFIIYLPRDKGC
jgi:hypothetical protein